VYSARLLLRGDRLLGHYLKRAADLDDQRWPANHSFGEAVTAGSISSSLCCQIIVNVKKDAGRARF
jgi:hypothetical protein